MATRAFPMSNSVSSANRKSGFTRRLFVLLLFVSGITFWTYVISQNQRIVSKDLMSVFVILMIALAAGVGARFLFYARNWFVRLVTAWASLILGLFFLGYLTQWKMGFGPIELWRKTYDWLEIAQVGGGMLLVIIALMLWWHGPATQSAPHKAKRSRPAKKRVERQVESPREHVERPVERDRPREQPRAVSARAAQPASRSSFPRRRTEPKPLKLRVSRQARAVSRSTPRQDKVVIGRLTKSKKVGSSRLRKLFQRTPEMQISTHEEHRCPFCLEEVKRNDPRGVKECSVCHTLHHKDCWDITGMCQVPHLNS